MKELYIQISGILLNIIPYFFLCYTPVWNSLRIKKKTVLIIIGIISFINISSIILIMAFIPTWDKFRNLHSLIFLCLYILTYILTVKVKPSKLVFVVFIVKGYADTLVAMAKFFEIHFFPYEDKQSYQFAFNLIVLLLLVVTSLPMWILLKKKVSLVIETETASWNFLWMIPTTLYFMNVTFNKMDVSIIKQWQFALFDFLMLIGSYIIYYVTIEMLLKTQSNAEFQERIYQAENELCMQTNQYEQLGSYIESSRRLNHDIRHHLVSLQGMAFKENTEPILNYLNSVISEMPVLSEIMLCENYAVNSLLCHYKGICEHEGIDFKCSVNLNPKHGIADKFLCVIFGNCLENALESCRRISDSSKFITIISKLKGTNLFITMDNSFNGNAIQSGNVFISSKRNNEIGIGLSSIRTITEKYNGGVKFYTEGQAFKTDIFLDAGPK